MKNGAQKFDLSNFELPPAKVGARPVVPQKVRKRREQFIQMPMVWVERLRGATGQTWHLAAHLIHLHWKGRGQPIKLANGMLQFDGIGRSAKWRALNDLERRGLIAIERRPKRSPIVRVLC